MVARAILLSLLFGGAAAVGTFLWLGEDLGTLGRVSLATLAAGIAWTSLNYLAGAVRLWLLTRRTAARIGIWRCARAHALGLFSAAVTPSGSGQAPAIVLALVGDGVPHPNAWAIVVRIWSLDLTFLAWAVPGAAIVLGSAGLPFDVSPWLAGAAGLALLTVAILLRTNLGALRRVALLVTAARPMRRFRRRSVRFLARLERANRMASGNTLPMRVGLHASTIAVYAGTYVTFDVIAGGLGSEASFAVTIAAVLLPTIASFVIPTPGGSGFIEVAAATVAREQLSGGAVATAVLVWRLLTHYSRFVVGAALGGPMLVRAAEALGGDRAEDVPPADASAPPGDPQGPAASTGPNGAAASTPTEATRAPGPTDAKGAKSRPDI